MCAREVCWARRQTVQPTHAPARSRTGSRPAGRVVSGRCKETPGEGRVTAAGECMHLGQGGRAVSAGVGGRQLRFLLRSYAFCGRAN